MTKEFAAWPTPPSSQGVRSRSQAWRSQGAGTQRWLLAVPVPSTLADTSSLCLVSHLAKRVVLFLLEM